MSETSISIVGGGAAGFFGAIACAEAHPKSRVTLYEKGGHVLTKVRVSGGGRCNVTHACFDPKQLVKNYPRGQQALLGAFHKFQPRDTITWFEKRGVALKTEDDGRMFPTTDTSFTIIQALKDAAAAAGVRVRTQAGPVSIESTAHRRFAMRLIDGEAVLCDAVLLATGSAPPGYQWARSLGHTIEPPVPSLFTFNIPDERLKNLSGVAVENGRAKILGSALTQAGPILITHWGLSGPAILKLSAWGARVLSDRGYEAQIEINWTGRERAAVEKELLTIKRGNPKKLVSVNPPSGIPRRLWERLVRTAAFPLGQQWAHVSSVQLGRLIDLLTADVYAMRGKSTFKEEFVTCGGVCLDEVDFRTMESRRCPGLYFAGEILDIDGVTGGFNFQNAWTTGWLAGRAMAEAALAA